MNATAHVPPLGGLPVQVRQPDKSTVPMPHLDDIKPHLRGWLHATTAPLALVSGIVLMVLAPTLRSRAGMAAFLLTTVLLFATSAVFHRGTWTPRVHRHLMRLDHACIFIVIAGTYTAFALTLLPDAWTLLTIVWAGAVAGIVFKVCWVHAPRWLGTSSYIALGWVAVFFLPALYDAAGGTVLALIAAGGVLYTAGAVVYAIRRPNPSPRWFGFHEVFHALTVLAFLTHVAAASLALQAAV